MPGIEIKGRSKIANYRHGGRTRKFGGGRTNLLEQLGRVEAEPSNPNRRAEISRVHGELNRGYAVGGVVKAAKWAAKKLRKPKPHRDKPPSKTHKDVPTMAAEGGRIGKAEGGRAGLKHGGWKKPSWMGKVSKMGKFDRKVPWRDKKTHGKDVPTMAAEGGRIGFKKGTDKKWIQKAVDPKHKGYCTPMTKKTCTPARKALARTFKKKAKTGWS